MNKYPAYKDSGIEWIGEIPEHWEVKKLKFVFESLNSVRVPLSAEDRGRMTNKQYDYYGASGIIDKVDDYLFDEELILIGEDGANLLTRSKRLAFIANGRYWVNNHAHIIRPKRGNIYYLSELLELIDYTIYVSGSAQPKLTQEALMSINIIEPPIDEQITISNYLELKTNQVDTLISNKQKLIELLKEERTAIINQAVTKGLDPNAPMKDSGIEWLGEIPEHWEVKKLKHISALISGGAFESDKFTKAGSYKVLKITNIQHDRIDWNDTEYLPDEYAQTFMRFQIKNGDILFALTRPIISSGIKSAKVEIDEKEKVLLNQRNAILRSAQCTSQDFLYYYTLSHYFYRMFESSIDNTGQQPNISPIAIENFFICMPSINEQIEIVKFVTQKRQRINTIITKTQQEINLLKEYKTALISEVVTGKVDVREEANCQNHRLEGLKDYADFKNQKKSVQSV